MSERIYTGGSVEADLFGKIEQEAKKKERPAYLPYKTAMNLVKELQPGDPTEPEADFANDLHATVAEKLGLEDYGFLKFYTAVGSELDFYHGVDAFFELEDPETNKTYILTLDLTLRSIKEKMFDLKDKIGVKADWIMSIDEKTLDKVDNKDAYDDFLNEESDSIVYLINSKRRIAG